MPAQSRNRLHKFKPGYSWSEVSREIYKDTSGHWCGIDRNTLVGGKGESSAFHLRYFEIAPGGNSSLEKHSHEHTVICVRGRGRALAGGSLYELENLDVLYIAPDEPHQLINPYNEPFGFFCIVDSERDRPRNLEKADIDRLESSEETRGRYIGYIEGD